MANDNTVTLSVMSYNQIKIENTKLSMFYAYLIRDAILSDDHQELVFESEKVKRAMEFCFPEDYRKKLSALKAQSSKKGNPA